MSNLGAIPNRIAPISFYRQMPELIDITNQQFGEWTVLSKAPSQKNITMWFARCSCGFESSVSGKNLRNGASNSCRICSMNSYRGYPKEFGYLRNTWLAMKARCYNFSHEHYLDYGGRGITVCDRWLVNFNNFIADMGHRPEGCSVERLNNDGNYTPENCIWADHTTQMRNRRNRKSA